MSFVVGCGKARSHAAARRSVLWSLALTIIILRLATDSRGADWGTSGSSVNFTQVRPNLRLIDETTAIVDIHDGKSIGPGVGCFLGACGGFELWASLDADLDLRANVFLGGSYQLAYKANQTTGAFALDPSKIVNSEFVLATSLDPVGLKKLDYTNSIAQAYVGIDGDLGGKIGAEGCIVGCLGGEIKIDPPPFEIELLQIKSGSIDIFGESVGSLPVELKPDSRGIVTVTANLPQFKKSFKDLPPGSPATYTSEQNVAMLNVDAAAAIAAALGLPPLKGSVGPADYNLLSINGWAAVNLRDNFHLTPGSLRTKYTFSSPVQVRDDDTGLWSSPTKNLTIASGEARTLRAPGALTLGILPTYELDLVGSADMDLIAAVGYDASALQIGAFGKSIGPLFHEEDSVPIATIDLASQSLSTTVATKGTPLTLQFQSDVGIPTNEEQTVFMPVTPPIVNDDGSYTQEVVLVTNADDPLCVRNPSLCRVDRAFPIVPINFIPTPDPVFPLEVAPDFAELSQIIRADDLISGRTQEIGQTLRELWTEFNLDPNGPPTVIEVGPGHLPLTEPVEQSEFIALGFPRAEWPGDFDHDGVATAADLDLLATRIRTGTTDPVFDLNRNGRVEEEDRLHWIFGLFGTDIGDSNLDGRFTSSDLVEVLSVGKYETRRSAGWAEGDWSGDGLFGTDDFVIALQAGGYERSRMKVSVVPEPTAPVSLLALPLFLTWLPRMRQRTSRLSALGFARVGGQTPGRRSRLNPNGLLCYL